MKLEAIKKEFADQGWNYKQYYDSDGIVHEFSKWRYGFVFVSDSERFGLVFSGGKPDLDDLEEHFVPDDKNIYPIGDVHSFDFSPYKGLNVRLYSGTMLSYGFDEDNPHCIPLEICPYQYPIIEKPEYENYADDRPHRFIIEVSIKYKTCVSVFAKDEMEAISLLNELNDDTFERDVAKHLDSDGYEFKAVRSFPNEHLNESQIDEFNVKGEI